LVAERVEEAGMPYRRGGFILTPPSMMIFLISLVLAVLAIAAYYGVLHIAILNASRSFALLAIAFAILTVGVLFRRV
jgi:hypothetical protein